MAITLINIFMQLQYEYGGMATKPTGFKYDMAKDLLQWNGLEPKEHIPLITRMFNRFVSSIPSK